MLQTLYNKLNNNDIDTIDQLKSSISLFIRSSDNAHNFITDENLKLNIEILELLAQQKKWDFIAELINHQIVKIHLERDQLRDCYTYINNIPWIFAEHAQWELLEYLVMYLNQYVDLNSTCTISSYGNSISIAWLLAKGQQFVLLLSLAQKLKQTIDLNVKVHAGVMNPLSGTSIAWLLARAGVYRSLKILSEGQIVDLNASCVGFNSKNEGISVARLLVEDKQYELLLNLAQNQCVELTENLLPDIRFKKSSITIPQALTKKNLDTLKFLIKKNNPQALCEEPSLQELITKLEQQQTSNSNSSENLIMWIAHKYIDMDIKTPITIKNNKRKYDGESFEDITSKDSMTLVSFNAVNQPNVEALLPSTQETQWLEIDDHVINMSLLQAESKPRLDSKSHCYMIIAGRTHHALVPPLLPDSRARCVIIITQDEYKALKPDGAARAYDYLIVNKFYPVKDAKLSSSTIRRRAAVHLAYFLNLSSMLMIDDNISSFSIPNDTASIVKSQKLEHTNNLIEKEITADSIYQTLRELQKEYLEPIISVPTSSNGILFCFKEGRLGCKAFMIDFARLKQHFNCPEDLLTLFPLNEKAFGEDYFMQIVAHFLFKNQNLQGFKIIDGHKMSITRSLIHKNACVLEGVKAKKLEDPNPELFQSPTYLDLYNFALDEFNRQIEQNLRRYQEDEKRKQYFNFPKKQMRELNCRLLPFPKVNLPPKLGLIENLKVFLDKTNQQQITNITLYKHQKEALYFLIRQLELHQSDSLTFQIATGCGKTLVEAIISFQALLANPKQHVVVVCPSIQLVQQTKDAFLTYALHALSDEMQNVIRPRIHAICTNQIPYSAFDFNDSLQKASLFIICVNSFQNLINNSKNIANIGLVLYDESHLVENSEDRSLIIETKTKALPNYVFYKENILTMGFSATPKINTDPTYIYPRERGIRDGILTPLLIDDSFQGDTFSFCELTTLLASHLHPSDQRPLIMHKGIIFVSSIPEAQNLSRYLQNNYPETTILQAHSKQNNVEEIIRQFKNIVQGIIIVVDMLKEGFDCNNVSWLILNKNNVVSTANRTQMIGRLLRKDVLDANKIGLAILPSSLNKKKTECTCFPDDIQQPDYIRAIDTLTRYREIEKTGKSNPPSNRFFYFKPSKTPQENPSYNPNNGFW